MTRKKSVHPLEANQKLNNEDLEEEFPQFEDLIQFQRQF